MEKQYWLINSRNNFLFLIYLIIFSVCRWYGWNYGKASQWQLEESIKMGIYFAHYLISKRLLKQRCICLRLVTGYESVVVFLRGITKVIIITQIFLATQYRNQYRVFCNVFFFSLIQALLTIFKRVFHSSSTNVCI